MLLGMDGFAERMYNLDRRNFLQYFERLRNGQDGGIFVLDHDFFKIGLAPEALRRVALPNGELLVDIDKPYCAWGDKDNYEHLADISSEHFAEIVRDSNDMLESMISAQRERGEGKCDSLGSFLDWLTIGIVSGIWEGFRESHIAMVNDPSFLNILNALTIGASDTVVGAITPDEPW